jgi:toxin ParE1/3/4
MARVHRSALARNDLAAIWLYIANENHAAADKLMDEISQTLTTVAKYPLIGESVDDLRPKTRRTTVGNYQLFYEPTENGICCCAYITPRGASKIYLVDNSQIGGP